jgi:hypothetical protein
MRTLPGVLAAALLVMLTAMAPAFAVDDPNRVVTAVDSGAKTFSCQAKAGEATYTYKTTPATVYRVAGKRIRVSYLWHKGSLSDLKVGEIVTVQFHLEGSDRIAERVAIYPKK